MFLLLSSCVSIHAAPSGNDQEDDESKPEASVSSTWPFTHGESIWKKRITPFVVPHPLGRSVLRVAREVLFATPPLSRCGWFSQPCFLV